MHIAILSNTVEQTFQIIYLKYLKLELNSSLIRLYEFG